MSKLAFCLLLCAGAISLAFGFQAINSFSSEVSNLFTGSPTDKAIGLIVGGAIAALIGLAGIFRSHRKA